MKSLRQTLEAIGKKEADRRADYEKRRTFMLADYEAIKLIVEADTDNLVSILITSDEMRGTYAIKVFQKNARSADTAYDLFHEGRIRSYRKGDLIRRFERDSANPKSPLVFGVSRALHWAKEKECK